MSVHAAERFPTYRDPDTGLGFGIPVHPEQGIFETTVAITSTGVVDHTEVERVMARPPWNFEEANYRLHREALDRRNAEFRAQQEALAKAAAKPQPAARRPSKTSAEKAAAVKRTPAKKVAAKKATPPKGKQTPKRRPQ